MCDYMYYEKKQKSRLKDIEPVETPELEKVEEQSIVVKA